MALGPRHHCPSEDGGRSVVRVPFELRRDLHQPVRRHGGRIDLCGKTIGGREAADHRGGRGLRRDAGVHAVEQRDREARPARVEHGGPHAVVGGDAGDVELGHAEAVEIVFDPTQTSYRDILAFFFQIHDPSTRNRQGNDVGTSYRSAIFPVTPEQEQIARDTIADVDASGLWPGKAVTTIEELGPFWQAEPEHQDYLLNFPNGYTCHFPRPGWVLPKRDAASTR